MSRRTPFALVFESVADRLPAVSAALEQSGADPHDRDAFLMIREVVEVVRKLRPDNGLGEGIDQLVALVHHAYLFWAAGGVVVAISAEQLVGLLASATLDASDRPAPASAYYIQLPERRVWAESVAAQPHEPLDGCFVHALGDFELRLLAIFGLHPDRLGFTVVEAAGRRPDRRARADGTPLFASLLPGGTAAGLFSLAGEEELLELVWRSRDSAEALEVHRWKA